MRPSWHDPQCLVDCARACTGRVRRPNVLFSRAAGDLAVGGSTADPSLVLSEDGGRVEARAPDATMNARLRKGTRTGRRDLPKHLTVVDLLLIRS